MIYTQEEVDDVLRWIGKNDVWFEDNDHIERRNYAISRLARTQIQDAFLADLKMVSSFFLPQSKLYNVGVNDPLNMVFKIEVWNGCQNMAWLGVAVEYRRHMKGLVSQ